MPYKRKEKSRTPWLAQVKINNKYVRKSFATKKEAVEWEVEQQKNVISLTPITSLGEWAICYLDFAKAKFVSTTYQEKKSAFKFFFSSIDKTLPVTQLTAVAVLRHLQDQSITRSGYAANKDRKNLVAAWNWGVKYLQLPKENPCLVERFPEKRQPRYVPTERDYWKVYEAAWTEQDATMLLGYLHLAARKSELFRLQWEDVDFAGVKIRLYTRKTKDGSWESSWLPLTEDLFDALLKQKTKRKSDKWVFPDPETLQPFTSRLHWMKNLCRRAQVKHFGLHAIRHLSASILAREGVAMIDIQTILRHKNLSTTERYIRRIESVRPALRLLPKVKSKIKPPGDHLAEKKSHLEINLSG
jgi:integrase